MSKGNPHYKARLDPETAAMVEATIAHRNGHSDDAPWTVSDFVRIACREKIAKMNRSRGRKLTVADEFVDLPLPAEQLQPDLFSDNTLESGGAFA